ncbi:two-component system sporulation sensor kinase B [Planomicrobium stackebrandtii]|uniref:histidine kinase n=1 Tax=Planomicrobium stackebrandtii TaxID=253160 RepID=A0ABU0GU89_9BACL|nr:HAMP domain-containing sensor histidine kinase [Planomicrobium stackebrandtii]MDQ0428928.1 two-component system sporulation sensor kinase B [Planomicrobium stackebrandtii]
MEAMMTGMINNIFFIIFPIIVYQMLATAGQRNFFVSHRVTMTVLFSISIILCMLFPYQFLTDQYIFDLRQVPMIVGALYGGPLVSAMLFLVSSVGRFFIGGDGMYIAILNQFAIAAGVPFLRPLYMRVKRLGKIVLVFSISIASLLFNMFAGAYFFGDPLGDILGIWVMLMINQGTIIVLTALLIEHMQRQEYMYNSLLKHEKMETVSHFAAAVSHELRNPLQSIKGFIQLMKEYEYSREKQVEFHSLILKEINAAEDLIDDYLVYAKPTYGQLESITVSAEIQHVMKIMAPYANVKDVEMQITDMDEQAEILIDRQKFQQALVNIIRNGIEAMPDGGTLAVAVKTSPAKVWIEVTDEGIGMTKEEVKRLGEPYFSNKIKGTGLGMMVTYSIVSQMNGQIMVDSEKGKGTEFTLEFPNFSASPKK